MKLPRLRLDLVERLRRTPEELSPPSLPPRQKKTVARKKAAVAAQAKLMRYLPMCASWPAERKALRPLTTHALVAVSGLIKVKRDKTTYVMRAEARAWKKRATEVVMDERYPPRRLQSARRPETSAMAAKKRATKKKANMKRDR